MRQFEVPYNMDPNFINYFKERDDLLPYVSCFYMAAWKEDCENTRYATTLFSSYPKNYEEYVQRLKSLQTLNVPVNILMQKGASFELIEKYIDLGVKQFTINDDELAKQLKEKYQDEIELTLSVTRSLTYIDLMENDYSMYDKIVLWVWFNRHLDILKQLPKQYSYTLLCNSRCVWNCQWHDRHWWLKADDMLKYSQKEQDVCKHCYEESMKGDQNNNSSIPPKDLEFFDPYIDVFKLVDRQMPTQAILFWLYNYVYLFEEYSKGIEFYNINEGLDKVD